MAVAQKGSAPVHRSGKAVYPKKFEIRGPLRTLNLVAQTLRSSSQVAHPYIPQLDCKPSYTSGEVANRYDPQCAPVHPYTPLPTLARASNASNLTPIQGASRIQIAIRYDPQVN